MKFDLNTLHLLVSEADGPSEELSRVICVALDAEDCGHVTGSLDAAARLVERTLPGWWWKVGTCHLSDDACVGPDYNNPTNGRELLGRFAHAEKTIEQFNSGFDLDSRPAGNLALALCNSVVWAHKTIMEIENVR
jgi:hypothetical protein